MQPKPPMQDMKQVVIPPNQGVATVICEEGEFVALFFDMGKPTNFMFGAEWSIDRPANIEDRETQGSWHPDIYNKAVWIHPVGPQTSVWTVRWQSDKRVRPVGFAGSMVLQAMKADAYSFRVKGFRQL